MSIRLVDDGTIAELNRRYRGVEGPTDVLAFPLEEPGSLRSCRPGEPPLLLGDVVISAERAREQADRYGHSFRRELAFLTIHGVLHLLGHDHHEEGERQRMRSLEKAALQRLAL